MFELQTGPVPTQANPSIAPTPPAGGRARAPLQTRAIVERPTDGGARDAEQALAAERVTRDSQAQRALLRVIEMQGGLAMRRIVKGIARWAAIDAEGRVIETLPTRSAESLAERGRLSLRRFGFGGEIYGIA